MTERWNPWTDQAVMPLAHSTHSHGDPTLALTNLTGTTASASNGLTLSLSAAAPGGGGWAIQGSGAYTQNTGTIQFANSNGITFGLSTDVMTASHNGLTTARASTDAIGLNTAATAVTWTVNSSGISLNAGAYLTTAQPPGAYLTTARASNDAIGLNTAATAVTWTVNSSGISLNAGAYLTTAAQSNHSHGNPTLALTNLTGTTASASDGLTISLAAAAPGGGATMSYFNLLDGAVAGTSAINVIGSSSVIVQPFFLPQAMSISYVRIPVSMGHVNSGSATTAARSWTLAQTDCYCVNFFSLGTGANSRSLQRVAGSSGLFTKHIRYEIGVASNNQSCSVTITGPSEGGEITYTTSFTVNSASFTFHTTGLSNSVAGFKWIDVPFASSLSAGAWWIAVQKLSTTATTTAGGNWAQLTNVTSRATLIGISQINTPILPWGVATNTSTGAAWQVGLGAWTTDSASTSSASMALSNILSLANVPLFNIQLVRQA
jgi:hypothetical protein